MKRFFRIVFLALFALICCPVSALAREMNVDAVQIDARVGTDGSQSVTERRTINVRGSYNGLYWDVHEGSYQGREIRATLGEVLAITGGEQVLLEEGQDGAAGTYELTDMGDYLRLKIFWPAEDETVTFQVSYDLANLPTRWADVGELYWQYVPADLESEGEWQNITCTVHLPVPDGTVVTPGLNVRAWGHGPLDSALSFEGDSVRFYSPGVGAREFLEARIVFPQEWLSEVPESDGAHLKSILAEEEQWAKDANAQRRRARLIVYGIPGGMCAVGILSIIAMKWFQKRRFKKMPKAQFTGKYFRDVPTNDHPAVLGMLYREGRIDSKDFSATLMQLVDQGRIGLDNVLVDRKTKRGGTKRQQEWRMLLHDETRSSGSATRTRGRKIDEAAYNFLHDVIADKQTGVVSDALKVPVGEPYVLLGSFDEVAQAWPEEYAKGYDGWDGAVRRAYAGREFEKELPGSEVFPGILGLGDFAIAVVVGVAGMFLGVPNLWLCIGIIVCFGCGIFIVLADEDTPTIVPTQEAVDIRAQLEGLKNWLLDFTRLEEAIPTDVVLWNRLLVMATELGVADKVVQQLKVFAPDLLTRSPLLAWVGSDTKDVEMPIAAIGRSAAAGRGKASSGLYHETSTSDIASSHDSSSRGSGGGFSSGGGGGFSGGGGRGGGF